ncbi:hypothetical protein [Clostridium botulinum]|uniref:hypothetical protein n=1 Tax=Clostridium botulinum TaxID=1491 RepID=UPI000957AE30|nr:hypothetical protein [Clostridium botulinum]APU61173.1 hypothetical protein NPD8_3132 [Clostridium botulinum]BDB02112.1 hypothetical protein CBOS2020_21860 [Clostridium botulinum]
MRMKHEMTKYPICDTDIWIKLCKLNEEKNMFSIYSKIFFADAVIQELKNKKNDNTREFGIGYDSLKSYKNEYFELNLNCEKFFSYRDKCVAQRLFLANKIEYDEESGLFSRNRNTGELVSLIYASIHNLQIILSDDGDTKIFKDKFAPVKVVDLVDVLLNIGFKKDDAIRIKREVSEPIKVKQARKQLEKGGLKDLTLLKEGLRLKELM